MYVSIYFEVFILRIHLKLKIFERMILFFFVASILDGYKFCDYNLCMWRSEHSGKRQFSESDSHDAIYS